MSARRVSRPLPVAFPSIDDHGGDAVYGINTGFGHLKNKRIETAPAGLISMLTFVFAAVMEIFLTDGAAPTETFVGGTIIVGAIALGLRGGRRLVVESV